MIAEKKRSAIREIAESIIIAVILALLIRTFLFQPFYIPSGSMLPTLQIDDKIIVNKLVFRFKDPNRGNIVVFKYPLDTSKDYIKRVIGLPGETLEIKNSKLLINGQEVKEGYLPPNLSFSDFGPVTIPEDSFFVMGDNRNDSQDSRYWGNLEKKYIIGKAVLIFWPFDRIDLMK